LRYSLSYTTAEIDSLEWADYIDLHRYWKNFPPTHILAAGWMGYKPKEDASVENANQDLAIEEMMAQFGVRIVPKEQLLGLGGDDGRQLG
jgi:hypothetical protein